jgi:hypothetical protein
MRSLVRKSLVRLFGSIALLSISHPAVRAQSEAPTNLEVIQTLVRDATKELLVRSKLEPGSIELKSAVGSGDRWIALHAITGALTDAGFTVYDSSSAVEHDARPAAIEVEAASYRVEYQDAHRSGLLGEKRVQRRVQIEIAMKATRRLTRDIVFSDLIIKNRTDTVRVDAIEFLETPGISSTRGMLPNEPFLDRIVEPLVIVGATGVAIYLLFNVRN